MRSVPSSTTGSKGSPVSIAIRNAPFLNGSIVPSVDRVPSGNTSSEWPRSAATFTPSLMACRVDPPPACRSIEIMPMMRIAVPTIGILNTSFLDR